GREFDVIAKRFCQTNGFAGLRDALLTGDAQLVLQVDVGGCEEHVNAGTGSMLQGLPGAFDVGAAGAGQSGDYGAADHFRDRLDGLKVTLGGDGEAGFDDIDAQAVELMGQAKLFLLVHAAAGGLLAISKSRVEYRNSRFFHRSTHLGGRRRPRGNAFSLVSLWYGFRY